MINISLPEVETLVKLKIRDGGGKVDKIIPKEEGVYFIFNESKELVYIGCTVNLWLRLSSHTTIRRKQKIQKRNNSNIPNGQAVYCSYIVSESLPVGTDLTEQIYQNEYRPKYNSIESKNNNRDGIIEVTPKIDIEQLTKDIDRMVF